MLPGTRESEPSIATPEGASEGRLSRVAAAAASRNRESATAQELDNREKPLVFRAIPGGGCGLTRMDAAHMLRAARTTWPPGPYRVASKSLPSPLSGRFFGNHLCCSRALHELLREGESR